MENKKLKARDKGLLIKPFNKATKVNSVVSIVHVRCKKVSCRWDCTKEKGSWSDAKYCYVIRLLDGTEDKFYSDTEVVAMTPMYKAIYE